MPDRRRRALGLRVHLTLSYVVLFTILLCVLGLLFRQTLHSILHSQINTILDDDWVAIRNYLKFEGRRPIWFFDRTDPEEAFIVERLRRVYLLTESSGRVLEVSEAYRSLGVDSPREIQETIRSKKTVWTIRESTEGVAYLIRSGVLLNDEGQECYLAIGRSLGDSHRILEQFTRNYFSLLPLASLGTGLLGWLMAGRALRPLIGVATAARSISGANLSLRIPLRGAGDELDHLIDAFNSMVDRLESSFNQIRQFSTDVSHELRTPLTAIRGHLEVALFTAKTAEQFHEAIATAMEDVERLSQIIRALLLLSQAESGQLALRKETLDLSLLVKDVVEQFQVHAEVGRISLEADVPPKCLLEADRIQIGRLVSNLLSNAIKYTAPEGCVRVGLRASPKTVVLAVEDTGRGIPSEHLAHIFDRFYRVPDSVRDSDISLDKGLGLGLSFVAWIVKAHGGKINVDSTEGKGSRFTVKLPVRHVPSSAAEPEKVGPKNI